MTWRIEQADATKLPLADQSVDLVLGSPPYLDRRTYGTEGISRKIGEWVPWMLDVTREALRVCSGPVLWVANGSMRDRAYRPAVEGLVWEAYKAGIRCEHPLIWSKNAAPNRKDWWCNGWEYVVAFLPDDCLVDFNWEAVASPQKFMSGGGFRQRTANGDRKPKPAKDRNPLARPYDLIRATVGGGQMGDALAHENEAPYPESLVAQIIPALTRPGQVVCDPFSGSGTTAAVAVKLGRQGVGYDCRLSQVFLGRKRLRNARPNETPTVQAEAAAPIEDAFGGPCASFPGIVAPATEACPGCAKAHGHTAYCPAVADPAAYGYEAKAPDAAASAAAEAGLQAR